MTSAKELTHEDFEVVTESWLPITIEVEESDDGDTPETWCCVDCGVNTAPGFLNRADEESAFAAARARGETHITVSVGFDSEIYVVREAVWKATGIELMGGCLCVGCLEKRLGRKLRPEDFPYHVYNGMPASPRLLERQQRKYVLTQDGGMRWFPGAVEAVNPSKAPARLCRRTNPSR